MEKLYKFYLFKNNGIEKYNYFSDWIVTTLGLIDNNDL